MVQLQITIDKNKILINIMSREDATPDEYELAKSMEALHFEVFKQAEAKIKVTTIEDLRHLTTLAPDTGDSAASSGIILDLPESASEELPTPPQRG